MVEDARMIWRKPAGDSTLDQVIRTRKARKAIINPIKKKLGRNYIVSPRFLMRKL